jgi:hypothetical protein
LRVSPEELERALKDLPNVGRRESSRAGREKEVWRFEVAGKPYYLNFYRRRGGRALREFTGLQAMQRADVPSPRAVAHLSGFILAGEKGDAVIVEGFEPATPLDRHLNEFELLGDRPRHYPALRRQVIEIVEKLGAAKLGHGDLRLERFLVGGDGRLMLASGEGVRGGGMKTADVLRLGASASRSATRNDFFRAWGAFSGAPTPKKNAERRAMTRGLLSRIAGDNENFGSITAGEWSGWFFKQTRLPYRWAPASSLTVSRDDWQREWPKLLGAVEANALEGLKQEKGGDVLAGEVSIGGRIVQVVVKRPRHSKWHRYIKELYKGLRARQAWTKAWSLVARDVPTAWPLLVMQRRNALGIPVQAIMVSERVNGELLATMDFARVPPRARVTLFHRLGRTLRLLERDGLLLYDSKSPNWVVIDDDKIGPVPVIVDVDGLRKYGPPLWPIDRLLRSLKENPTYTPEDSKWVCYGYAPRARLVRENASPDPADEEDDAGIAPTGER